MRIFFSLYLNHFSLLCVHIKNGGKLLYKFAVPEVEFKEFMLNLQKPVQIERMQFQGESTMFEPRLTLRQAAVQIETLLKFFKFGLGTFFCFILNN